MKKLDYQKAIDLLRIDSYERKTRNWPLIKLNGDSIRRGNPRDTLLVEGIVSSSRNAIYGEFFDIEKAIQKLRRDYPLMETVLSRYPGKLIVAGGAIFRSIHDFNSKSDLDFFFINCEKKEIEDILRDLFENVFRKEKSSGCLRNLKTTTFLVDHKDVYVHDPLEGDTSSQIFGTKYQFVHSRSYPNAASVIGGFDLPVAACYYDGKEIYTTTLGFLSITYKFNIIDPSRRSTTYEQRLRKYSKLGVNVIFPFLERSQLTLLGIENGWRKNNSMVRVEIVKGLQIWFDSRGSNDIVREEIKEEIYVGDYGPVALGYSMTNFFNAVLAAKGNWEALTWYGSCISDIFEIPDINLYWPRYFLNDERPSYPKELALWMSEEEALLFYVEQDEEKRKETWREKAREVKRKVKKSVRTLEDYVEKNGVHYLGPNENPGRQGDIWTSSFNPITEDIRNYYSKGARISQLFISHETAFLLKCIMGSFYQRDTFRYILKVLAETLYLESMERAFPSNTKEKNITTKCSFPSNTKDKNILSSVVIPLETHNAILSLLRNN